MTINYELSNMEVHTFYNYLNLNIKQIIGSVAADF